MDAWMNGWTGINPYLRAHERSRGVHCRSNILQKITYN
jgi:hypothetical protein